MTVPAALVALALAAAPAAPAAEAARPSPAAAAPSRLDRLKAMAGEWSGNARGPDGKTFPAKATVRVVSGGSAVMLVTGPGTEHEMVTLFHDDDGALLATHYCAAMNQPRLKAQPGGERDPLVFEFLDGTNLKTKPGRMQRLVVETPDARRHVEEWTYREPDGKTATMKFELTRDGAPPPAAPKP
jgi:hypothetical protein